MKSLIKIIFVALFALSMSGSQLYGYALYYDADSDLDAVDILVFKSEGDWNKMLEEMEIAPQVKYWLLEAGKTAGKIIAALTEAQASAEQAPLGAGAAPEKASKAAAKAPIDTEEKKKGKSNLVTISKTLEIAPPIIEALWSFAETPISTLIRTRRAIAYHNNVSKGNKGKGAQWNYKSIAQQLKLGDPEKARSTTLYMVVTSPGARIPLLQGKFHIGSAPRFAIKANPDGSLKPIFKSGFVR